MLSPDVEEVSDPTDVGLWHIEPLPHGQPRHLLPSSSLLQPRLLLINDKPLILYYPPKLRPEVTPHLIHIMHRAKGDIISIARVAETKSLSHPAQASIQRITHHIGQYRGGGGTLWQHVSHRPLIRLQPYGAETGDDAGDRPLETQRLDLQSRPHPRLIHAGEEVLQVGIEDVVLSQMDLSIGDYGAPLSKSHRILRGRVESLQHLIDIPKDQPEGLIPRCRYHPTATALLRYLKGAIPPFMRGIAVVIDVL